MSNDKGELPMNYYRKNNIAREKELETDSDYEDIIIEEEEEEVEIEEEEEEEKEVPNYTGHFRSKEGMKKDTSNENMHRWYGNYHSDISKTNFKRGVEDSEVIDETESPNLELNSFKKAIN
mmetsp:Transcript_22795/g.25338  ORF Transcript_22795/g.25338 Transcript_22795/m.25338 type:complete len:121 (+) Transcript_22795:504-866(+)|eukprot:CAMPEP_0205830896 /NCGR_PEP_ID=MMETSP0206-20130828/42442_1 /ASSEMBLY_ACC=CAM_ASM_000279 /TAXON_ID=36767 /ORGANISM="Euplotes focardii, Strain TN1" /LENGTH=120 /DNA_ID=CAMNT_0053134979 /DNA_START=498 /DNA_END=860 /DNA_ORIENTATION=+